MQAGEESEASSSVDVQNSSAAATASDKRGKHRILAELKRLEQETRSLEGSLRMLSAEDGGLGLVI